jgi:hypothetical protein
VKLRVPQDAVETMNILICLVCLLYLYYSLDKDIQRVYSYAKSLDSEMVRLMVQFERKSADVPNVQNPST